MLAILEDDLTRIEIDFLKITHVDDSKY
jgi:hypothetical protein